MRLNEVHNIYFIGIGGIGMSALARYFHHLEKRVAGYDRVSSQITDQLQQLGISIDFEEAVQSIPSSFLDKERTLVVYTPAIPNSHAQLQYFKKNDFTIKKRAEVLGLVTHDTFCMAVAGTHGKTTTSTILAHLLKECGVEFTAFLGGVSENYQSNYIHTGSGVTVVEADEFDRSFLQLSPDVACITSMDADHLDIYGEAQALEDSFRAFAEKIPSDGKLFVKKGLPIAGQTFGIEDEADFTVQNISIHDGTYFFDAETPVSNETGIQFNQPGRHNLLNALVALAMAAQLDIPLGRLAKALSTYRGVKRRFTYHIKTADLVLIDDYAHHPTEIDAVYEAVRELYPDHRNLVVFQPHLFTRTRDFVDDFATSLSKFDEVLLLDIYPARELPIRGVTSEWLLAKVDSKNKRLVSKEELPIVVKESNAQVILMLGAGDIGIEVEKVKEVLAYAS